ncbi:hypothetical protein GCM10010404_34610 [Nonomuraea africana]
MGKRANNEGSIFPYKTGYAGYVWVTTPEGRKTRKWCYGKTREETHEKWIKLHELARKGPVVTKSPKLSDYLAFWLRTSWNRTSRPRRPRTTRCSPGCTSCLPSARSGSTS